MKTNLNLKIKAAKNTRLGRLLCRLVGDQRGAVMMEYVILGVMIAAACTLAAIFFGDQIRGAFKTMIHATAGDTQGAQDQATKNQQAIQGEKDKIDQSGKTIAPGANQ